MKKVHLRITLMMVILIAILMILSALVIALPGMQGREYGMNPAATSSSNIQPNPTLNTNITWSTFFNGWSPLEYTNGTANLTLNADMSSIYTNPISIDPAKISGITGRYAPSTNKTDYVSTGGQTVTGSDPTTSNASGKFTETLLGTDNGTAHEVCGFTIPVTALPSNNPAYDYITIIMNATGKYVTGGFGSQIYLQNESNIAAYGEPAYKTPEIYGTGTYFTSFPLSSLTHDTALYGNMNISANSHYTVSVSYQVANNTVGDTFSATLDAFMITETPIFLGSNNTTSEVMNGSGNIRLTNFSPNFAWSSIIDDGYSVAVSQPLQNLTTQQSAINTLNYIEQVEYQGQLSLPTAPDLSYGLANITEQFNVSTSQTQVLDINGVSYLSTISGKNNTVLLLSSVNPNGQTQFLQIVDYTQSQWTSISSPPGIFTLAGIEYYWEEFIIAILAIVGVGAGAASRHASNLRRVK